MVSSGRGRRGAGGGADDSAAEVDDTEEDVSGDVKGMAISQSRRRKRSVIITFSIHEPRSLSSVMKTTSNIKNKQLLNETEYLKKIELIQCALHIIIYYNLPSRAKVKSNRQ